ncbi:MAG: 2'-5' RNA ligase family protein [Candidatus Sumerlaeaceae bacterium]
MNPLYTLAYPQLSARDRVFIDDFRRRYDIPFRDVVAPHWTLAFGCTAIPESEYRQHVREIAQVQPTIRFCCRYAMVGVDDANDNYYVFLVPDDGFSDISRLHDRLYTGELTPYLRLDIPYVPHIGIATIADRRRIKELCDELNSTGLTIHGRISSITVCSYDGSKIEALENFPLADVGCEQANDKTSST